MQIPIKIWDNSTNDLIIFMCIIVSVSAITSYYVCPGSVCLGQSEASIAASWPISSQQHPELSTCCYLLLMQMKSWQQTKIYSALIQVPRDKMSPLTIVFSIVRGIISSRSICTLPRWSRVCVGLAPQTGSHLHLTPALQKARIVETLEKLLWTFPVWETETCKCVCYDPLLSRCTRWLQTLT